MTAKRTVMTGKCDGHDNTGDSHDFTFIKSGTAMTVKETVMTVCLLSWWWL